MFPSPFLVLCGWFRVTEHISKSTPSTPTCSSMVIGSLTFSSGFVPLCVHNSGSTDSLFIGPLLGRNRYSPPCWDFRSELICILQAHHRA
jgi:hypothetical protein